MEGKDDVESSTKINQYVIPSSDDEETKPGTTNHDPKEGEGGTTVTSSESSQPVAISVTDPQEPQSSSADVKREADADAPKNDNGDSNSGVVDPNGSLTGSGSSCSSPIPMAPWKQRYSVRILPDSVTRDGETVLYTLESTRLSYPETSQLGSSGKGTPRNVASSHHSVTYQVRRQYEDFELLEHCLSTAAFPCDGLILPPLPPKPSSNPSQVEMSYDELKSSKKLGGTKKTLLICDEWHKDCWHLQEWLRLMLIHPTFGKNIDVWERFLTAEKAAPRVRIKKSNTSGIISKISDYSGFGPDHYRNVYQHHRDCDEFFQREKDWVFMYHNMTRDTLDSFNARILARIKLIGVLGHLSTAFTLNSGHNDSIMSRKGYKFFNLFSTAIDNYRKSFQVMNYNDEATIGSCLELWTGCLEAEREMLYRRTCLLMEYENCNRNLDRLKNSGNPSKKDSAESSKLDAERAFEDCSDMACQEIKRFHRERSKSLASALERYAESQLLVARDTFHILQHHVQILTSFEF